VTRSHSVGPPAAFAACSAIWGSTFLFISLGNQSVPPFWALSLRLALASAVLLLVARLTKQALPRGRALRVAAVFGVLQFGFSTCLLYWGETVVSSGLTAVFFATVPLTTALFAWVLSLERFQMPKALGGLIALAGVAIIFGGQERAGIPILPMLAVLAAATLAAFSGVWLKRGPRQSALAVNAIACPAGLLVSLIFSFAGGETHAIPTSWPAIYPILYLTLAGSLIAFVIYAWLVNHWDVTRVSYIAVIVPLVALFLGTVIGQEQIGIGEWIGSLLVLSGVTLGLRSSRAPAEVGASG